MIGALGVASRAREGHHQAHASGRSSLATLLAADTGATGAAFVELAANLTKTTESASCIGISPGVE
jgi:hypothetical protein